MASRIRDKHTSDYLNNCLKTQTNRSAVPWEYSRTSILPLSDIIQTVTSLGSVLTKAWREYTNPQRELHSESGNQPLMFWPLTLCTWQPGNHTFQPWLSCHLLLTPGCCAVSICSVSVCYIPLCPSTRPVSFFNPDIFRYTPVCPPVMWTGLFPLMWRKTQNKYNENILMEIII